MNCLMGLSFNSVRLKGSGDLLHTNVNKLNITDSLELSKVEEKISKKNALELFENEILDAYFAYTTIDKTKVYTTQSYANAMNQSIYPFSTFLDLYIGDNRRIPEMLSEKGFSLFAQKN